MWFLLNLLLLLLLLLLILVLLLLLLLVVVVVVVPHACVSRPHRRSASVPTAATQQGAGGGCGYGRSPAALPHPPHQRKSLRTHEPRARERPHPRNGQGTQLPPGENTAVLAPTPKGRRPTPALLRMAPDLPGPCCPPGSSQQTRPR